MHDDICEPIKPATPGGKTVFLLLVDDKSHFMWLILLQARIEAIEAIKREQKPNAVRRCECCAWTEVENSPQRASVSTMTSSACSDNDGNLALAEWGGGTPKSDHHQDSKVIADEGRDA